MRRILLTCLVSLASCSGEPDTFTVIDPDDLARSAVLQLDGSDQSLERDGKRFATTHRIGLEFGRHSPATLAKHRVFS